jgi:CubicO group peptidase (beta-lactamase class C family)
MQRAVFTVLAYIAFAFVPIYAQDANQNKVDAIFSSYTRPGSPGCAVGVIRNGNFIYRKAYGLASLELNVPLSSQSVFYVGSVSKQFTAASVVLAAEQGFLSLDDNVRKYIPELPDYGHPITLRQMLHHTSGFRDFLTLLYLSGQNVSDLHSADEVLALIARQKGLNNLPGDEFIYSNTNYFLLGEVLKRAAKKPLSQFAAQNIFRPLGMGHTRFYDDHTVVVPDRVSAYDPGEHGTFLVDWSTNFDTVGAGGLMTSIDDLFLWDRNFYQNKLGKGTLLKEMQTPGVLNKGKQISYALGLELGTYLGLPIVEHNGALFGYRAEILRFPQQKFSVLCLCNLSNIAGAGIARQVADVYLEKELQRKPGEQTSSADGSLPSPAPFAGKYFDPRTHLIYAFTVSDGDLMGWGVKLPRIGPNQYKDLGDDTITFASRNGVMTATLIIDGEPYFAGSMVESPRLGQAELQDFAGDYKSNELNVTYKISVDHEALVLHLSRNSALKLEPIARDEFDGGGIDLVFHRNDGHHVSGLSVFVPNARNLAFDKTD